MLTDMLHAHAHRHAARPRRRPPESRPLLNALPGGGGVPQCLNIVHSFPSLSNASPGGDGILDPVTTHSGVLEIPNSVPVTMHWRDTELRPRHDAQSRRKDLAERCRDGEPAPLTLRQPDLSAMVRSDLFELTSQPLSQATSRFYELASLAGHVSIL